tara:strand:+ start:1044 stop:1187 length:144 start_codon:yes stop_codon:yes gene_type:complete
MSEKTPDFVIKYVAEKAVRNEDLDVLVNLVREGHTDIVEKAIRNHEG